MPFFFPFNTDNRLLSLRKGLVSRHTVSYTDHPVVQIWPKNKFTVEPWYNEGPRDNTASLYIKDLFQVIYYNWGKKSRRVENIILKSSLLYKELRFRELDLIEVPRYSLKMKNLSVFHHFVLGDLHWEPSNLLLTFPSYLGPCIGKLQTLGLH